MRRTALFALAAFVVALPAFADEAETKTLFDDGVHALQQERPNEAIASFEPSAFQCNTASRPWSSAPRRNASQE